MDTLDELIGERRIEPQLAMKILSHFDRSIAEVLQDKVKSRMSFKVRFHDFIQEHYSDISCTSRS